MNAKTLCAILIALLVGLGLGYFIWGGDPEPPPPASTRGEWPMVPCPPDETAEGQMAFEVCDQITNLAMQVQPPTVQSMGCAVKAQRKKSADSMRTITLSGSSVIASCSG